MTHEKMFMNVVIRCHLVNYVISYARLTLFMMSFPDLWSGKKEDRLGLEVGDGESFPRIYPWSLLSTFLSVTSGKM